MIELNNTKRKIIYTCNHRGCKEMDFIFSNFVNNHLNSCSETEINILENLIGESDLDILDWITNKRATPTKYMPLINKLRPNLLKIDN